MKPMLKYRGGKSKEIEHFLKYIPDYHGRYIEPFFGGGSLFFAIEPEESIINDINTRLMNFYIGVRDNFEVLSEELIRVEAEYSKNRKDFERLKSLHPDERVEDRNEALYYQIRDMYNGLIPSLYSEAFLYYFINKTSYSGMIRYNAKGEYNVPYGRYKNFNISQVDIHHHDLLARSQIFNCDYSEIFNMAEPDDYMFLDPPYDCIFSDYGNVEYKDGFSEQDHIELAERFRALGCKALMVIGKTDLTYGLYQDMIVDEYDKTYSVNIRNRFRSSAKHILVTNY